MSDETTGHRPTTEERLEQLRDAEPAEAPAIAEDLATDLGAQLDATHPQDGEPASEVPR